MATNHIRILALVGALALAGCVSTRDPQLTSVVQGNDDSLTCKQMQTEYHSNTDIALNKIERNRSNDNQDILVGALIWPGLADFKNADGVEGNNLLDRNIRLRALAAAKKCDTTAWPQQPGRYK